MMKTFVIFSALVVLASTSIVIKNGRRYNPNEEKETERQYMVIVDDDGKSHLVNMKYQTKIVDVAISDVKLYLYTNDHREGELLSPANFDDLLNSQYYNPANKNLFISHGWHGSQTSGLNRDIRNALFNNGENLNVFVIDWNSYSQLFYTVAVAAVPQVGAIVGNYINQIINHFDLTPDDFVVAGHSLGGNVAGCVGAAVDGLVDQIVALDPAWPGFSLANIDARVDETDGKTVHVIHTNGGFQGFMSSIGHADFFFNGGTKQAGCGPDLTGSCSHGRAVDYYVESLTSANFRAVRCDDYTDFTTGSCNGNEEVIFGQWPLDNTQFGDYHMDTAESRPFALG